MIIYKFPISLDRDTYIRIQPVAKWLDIQEQNGQLVAWALINNQSPNIRTYRIMPLWTGEPCDFIATEYAQYIKTIQTTDGLVWHFFVCEENT